MGYAEAMQAQAASPEHKERSVSRVSRAGKVSTAIPSKKGQERQRIKKSSSNDIGGSPRSPDSKARSSDAASPRSPDSGRSLRIPRSSPRSPGSDRVTGIPKVNGFTPTSSEDSPNTGRRKRTRTPRDGEYIPKDSEGRPDRDKHNSTRHSNSGLDKGGGGPASSPKLTKQHRARSISGVDRGGGGAASPKLTKQHSSRSMLEKDGEAAAPSPRKAKKRRSKASLGGRQQTSPSLGAPTKPLSYVEKIALMPASKGDGGIEATSHQSEASSIPFSSHSKTSNYESRPRSRDTNRTATTVNTESTRRGWANKPQPYFNGFVPVAERDEKSKGVLPAGSPRNTNNTFGKADRNNFRKNRTETITKYANLEVDEKVNDFAKDSKFGVEEMVSVVLKKHKHRLVAAAGSVINFKGDAIVNAANTKGLGGGGIDGAINKAGGAKLLDEREALPIVNVVTRDRIPEGCARMTGAGGILKVSHVIHAVGPKFEKQGSPQEDQNQNHELKKAYTAALEIAQKQRFKAIGFTLLSGGIFRGPRSLENVITLGLEAIIDWCNKSDYPAGQPPMEIFLCAFTKDEQSVLRTTMNDVIKRKVRGAGLKGCFCASG